ncbi:MAG: F0F1 ATP synthase subunit B [Actinomycetota bacterium]|jgi:F-type H+-transporting ATPase subunit b|nr:F0F1 ATP synthase subunit B [Euzebyaceae bacterium]MDQ3030154.1 F0F1 ATP synthase subunit B [Actinomycetota bacterium]MDQ3342279.1 F0F1 ATP synthase subunit B [Actinomycetota bacterium]
MQVVATIFVLATEAGEEASGLDLVLPDTAELIWGLVGFALLMVVMVKKVFPALNKMLDERQAKIQGQIEEAESQRQEAEQLRRQYAEQLADARGEANAIVEQARSDAERVRADVTSRAEEEANQIRTRAREDADAERGRVIQDLRGQVATLSVDLASQIVQRELDPERHRALVDQYINELSGMN